MIDDADIDAILLLTRAAGEGDIGEVKRLIPLTRTHEFALWALPAAAKFGQIECMKVILDACVGPLSDRNLTYCVAVAVKEKQMESLKFILSIYDQRENKTFDVSGALDEATDNNDLEMLRMLMPYCNSKTCGNQALKTAICNDNMAIFELLLPISDPRHNDSDTLTAAVLANRPVFFDILLPLSDLSGDDHIAFREAVHLGYIDFAKKMYPLIDVEAVKTFVVNEVWDDNYEKTKPEFFNDLLEIEAQAQKHTLHNSISQYRSAAHNGAEPKPTAQRKI